MQCAVCSSSNEVHENSGKDLEAELHMSRRKRVPVLTFPQMIAVIEDRGQLASGWELPVTKLGEKQWEGIKNKWKRLSLWIRELSALVQWASFSKPCSEMIQWALCCRQSLWCGFRGKLLFHLHWRTRLHDGAHSETAATSQSDYRDLLLCLSQMEWSRLLSQVWSRFLFLSPSVLNTD